MAFTPAIVDRLLGVARAQNHVHRTICGVNVTDLAVRRDGTQKNVVDTMQTRMELYDRIGYHDFEQKLDALFAQQKSK